MAGRLTGARMTIEELDRLAQHNVDMDLADDVRGMWFMEQCRATTVHTVCLQADCPSSPQTTPVRVDIRITDATRDACVATLALQCAICGWADTLYGWAEAGPHDPESGQPRLFGSGISVKPCALSLG